VETIKIAPTQPASSTGEVDDPMKGYFGDEAELLQGDVRVIPSNPWEGDDESGEETAQAREARQRKVAELIVRRQKKVESDDDGQEPEAPLGAMSGDIAEEEWKDEALRNPRRDARKDGKRRNAMARAAAGKGGKQRDVDPRVEEITRKMGYAVERIPMWMRVASGVVVALICAMLIWIAANS